jgi:hypothetical protein
VPVPGWKKAFTEATFTMAPPPRSIMLVTAARVARSAAKKLMFIELEDKVCVVTGASKGIGLAVTRALVAEGAVVVAGARTIENLHDIERVTSVAVDLGSRDCPSQLVKRAVDDHGRIDVLVNNLGGVRLRLKGFLGTSDEDFEWAGSMRFTQREPYSWRFTSAARVAQRARGTKLRPLSRQSKYIGSEAHGLTPRHTAVRDQVAG